MYSTAAVAATVVSYYIRGKDVIINCKKFPKRLECLISQGFRDSVTCQVRLDTTVKQLIQEQD